MSTLRARGTLGRATVLAALVVASAFASLGCSATSDRSPSAPAPSVTATQSLPPAPRPRELLGTPAGSITKGPVGEPLWDWPGNSHHFTYADVMRKASDVSFPATPVVGEAVKQTLDHLAAPRPIDNGVIVQYSSGVRLLSAPNSGFDPAARVKEVAALAKANGVTNPLRLEIINGRPTEVDPGVPWELKTGPGGRQYVLGGAYLIWVEGGRIYNLRVDRMGPAAVAQLVAAADTMK